MALPCFYHAKLEAVGVCDECGVTICDGCRKSFGELSSCPRCAEAVRIKSLPKEAKPIDYSRAGISYPGHAAEMAVHNSPEDTSGVAVLTPGPAESQDPEEAAVVEYDPARSLMGLAFGLIVGAIACWLIMKILEHTTSLLSVFYIPAGVLVARSMKAMARQGNVELALGAIVVMVTSLLFAHIAYTQDIMRAGIVHVRGHDYPTFSGAFFALMSQMGFIHWACAIIGIAASWRSAKQP